MARKTTRAAVRALTAGEADAVCRELVPIGDHVFDLKDQLQQAGFAAFIPANRLEESYCHSDDVDAHRRYTLEHAKDLLGRPFQFRATPEERSRFYRSPYIQKLLAERDQENGVPESELSVRYPGEIWRLEIDSCRKAIMRATIQEPDLFKQRSQEAQREQREIIAREASRYDSNMAQESSFQDVAARYELFWEIMSQEAVRLGFEYDRAKSKSGYPVFSKHGGGDWDLCWAIEDAVAFFPGPKEGSLELSLELRPRGLTGRLSNAGPGQFLIFAYQRIVPGFLAAYRQFHSFSELALCIHARLTLYSLIAPTLEAGVKKVLGGGDP